MPFELFLCPEVQKFQPYFAHTHTANTHTPAAAAAAARGKRFLMLLILPDLKQTFKQILSPMLNDSLLIKAEKINTVRGYNIKRKQNKI